MFKKGLLLVFILIITGCAGTIRLAEEDKKGLTMPSKNTIVKPSQ